MDIALKILIRIVGIVFIFAGVVYLLKPDVMKRIMEFFKQGKRIYLAGLIRLVLAIIFLLGASECKKPWVIIAFGILFIIGGLLIFILGLEKLKRWIEWWQKQSNLLLRVLAVIALALGAIIIYSA